MAPLETVYRSQITYSAMGKSDRVEVFAGSVAIPDFDPRGCKGERGCRAADEPEKFGEDGTEEDAFRCEEG